MNFDGKSIVINTLPKTFISYNNRAFIIDTKECTNIDFNSIETNFNLSFVVPEHMTNENKIAPIRNKTHMRGFIPYTVQVNDNVKVEKLPFVKFIIVRDNQKHREQNFRYITERIYTSALQPTNIKYNPKTAVVYGATAKELKTGFAGVTANVNSKVEIIIPDKITSYNDMSLVIQKNSFIEIKVPKDASEVLNVPEQLTYSAGYIKGVFTKSGEYNIRLKYQDGEQILNIIVPYYQRLL